MVWCVCGVLGSCSAGEYECVNGVVCVWCTR